MLGLLISLRYIFELDQQYYTLCGVYQLISFSLNLLSSTESQSRPFGAKFLIYSIIYIPFLATLAARQVYITSYEPDYYLLYASVIIYLIGICGKIQSLNRNTSFKLDSELCVTVACVMLCPLDVKTLLLIPLQAFVF